MHLRHLLWIVPPLVAAPLPAQELQRADLGQCSLEVGQVLEPCQITYRTFGELNAARDNAILVPTWFGGTSATWVGMIGTEFLDPSQYFVIVVDALGNGVSSSPSNSPTQSNGAFPSISIRDMVRTQYRLATEVLQLHGLHAVLGLSMGGMQTFEWLVLYPDFLQRAIPIIGSPQLGPYDIALWQTELRLLELYDSCQCLAAKTALEGVNFLAGATPSYHARLADRDSVSARLVRAAERRDLDGGRSYDVASQLRAMINHDVSVDFGGDLQKAAESIQARLLVIVGSTDHMVTPEPALAFADLAGAEQLVLENDCGHGATTCGSAEMSSAIAAFLSRRE